LRDDWRQAVSLYYIEKAPINEVAQSLNKSEAATRVVIHRALKELRQIIEEA
jgi:DNA-directed RNA polymerase specialized sigma24 family protein